jgi:Tfp pilus assembly protein PilF
MQSLWFWSNWHAGERRVFWILVLACVAAITFFCYAYFQYPSLTFIYEQFQEMKLIEVVLRTFKVGLSTVEVPSDKLLLVETFAGSELQPIPWVFYVFLFCLAIGLLLFLTFISTLKRYSFLAGMGLFILVVVNFHWEVLLLFGLTNKMGTIVVILLYGIPAYYFQSFRTECTFNFRLMIFAVSTIVLAISVSLVSRVPSPFLHLAVNGLTTGMVMSIIFILMISHEIAASFVSIVTSVQKPRRTAAHYYIISAIYLSNLLITYLIREKYLYWNIFTINSFLLLTISSIVGLWGLRKREPLYSETVGAISTVTFLYLGFLVTTFATIGFCFATHSTTMMEGFDDVILFTHLAYGIIFTAYVTANFGPMLLANLPVHKILYKPSTMPFFTFRTGSLIATFAFLSYSYPLTTYFDRATAAYYNEYGDVYQWQGDDITAEAYYKKSIGDRNQNHHAHYALATLYTSQLDPAKALKEYTTIIKNTPSEISYVNLSDAYQSGHNHKRAGELLTEGLRMFPGSGVLLNAQALNYYELGLFDSSLLYFQKARRNSFAKATAETNLFAIAAQMKLKFPADSLLKLLGSEETGAQSNALALASIQQLSIDLQFTLPKDSILDVKDASLLANHLTTQSEMDTALLAPIVSLVRKEGNSNFKEYLLVAAAHSYYMHGMVRKATDLLREMAFTTGSGKYFQLLGVWLLEQDNPATAALYFKEAQQKGIYSARYLQALAWTEADSLALAAPLWDSLAALNDSLTVVRASLYTTIINSGRQNILNGSDEVKYGFCKYRLGLADSILFHELVMSIQDEELRARAIVDRSQKWFAQDEPNRAIAYLALLKGSKLADKSLADDILFYNLMLAAETSNWDFVRKKLAEELPEGYVNEKIYLKALLDWQEGRQDEAQRKFNYLKDANVQFEEAMLAAANFYSKDADKLLSYSILVNALLAKPNSIKLLKAYVMVAVTLGFDEEARLSVVKLKKLMTPIAFARYIKENQILF